INSIFLSVVLAFRPFLGRRRSPRRPKSAGLHLCTRPECSGILREKLALPLGFAMLKRVKRRGRHAPLGRWNVRTLQGREGIFTVLVLDQGNLLQKPAKRTKWMI